MPDFLSPEDATEGNDYGSLEERIFNTSRNHDRELQKTIRLAGWQEMVVNKINNRIGTNQSEVLNRAYSEGLKIIRDEIGEMINGVVNLFLEASEVYDNTVRDEINVLPLQNNLVNVDTNNNRDYELSEPTSIPIRDSELSEVKKTFIDNAYFGGWVHRDIIGLGLGTSEFAGKRITIEVEKIVQDIEYVMETVRSNVERAMADFLLENLTFFMEEGMDEVAYQHLLEFRELMETDRKDAVDKLIGDGFETVKV